MRTGLLVTAAILLGLLCSACSNNSSGGGGSKASGQVVDGTDAGVAGAVVYIIPNSLVDTTTILNATILSGEAELYDEPLEDAADSGDPSILMAVTDAGGAFNVGKVPAGRYFVFVRPDPNDTTHLPGGDLCREALDQKELKNLTIVLSGRPSAAATFVGSSTCLQCHSRSRGGYMHTAHANGIMKTGDPAAALQDPSKYPDFFNGLSYFTSAAAYTDPGVTVLYCGDFDEDRGFDKFKVSLDPMKINTLYLRAYLWQDSTSSTYRFTFVNAFSASDIATYDIGLTYGGTVYKQRYMTTVPGRKGHYPTLQYQTEGKDTYYDRTRWTWRDYHLDWYWNDAAKRLQPPPTSKTFEGNCGSCHAPGYKAYKDLQTGEWLTETTPDTGSNYDLDGDSRTDELNVGCEKCHGPGSEHANTRSAATIVAVSRLSPSRANQICGFCHDRQKGNGSPPMEMVNDNPINQANEFPRAGIRRADYLAEYITRKGPSANEIYKEFDAIHAKSHHEHFPDTLKSKHYRNPYHLVVCSDCHSLHSKTEKAQLKYSLAPDSQLCRQCHTLERMGTVTEHQIAKIGTPMTGQVTSCVACHMPKTAKTGAGRMGFTLATPTGTETDEDIVFWENDITSHTMVIPSKFTAYGKKPGNAMPAPYTNSCGYCHVGGSLSSKQPYDSSACGGCHAGIYGEWQKSGHSTMIQRFVTTTSSSYPANCFRCHIGQEFVEMQVAGDSGYDGKLPYTHGKAQECVVCHYPHFGNGIAEPRLRMEGKALVPEYETYIEVGKARLCVNCHNSRTADPEPRTVAVWNTGASEWRLTGTPHVGNQSETFFGIGAVTSYTTAGLKPDEISDTIHATQNFILPGQRSTQACLTCHMSKTSGSEPHTWHPSIDACATCHSTNLDWPEWGGAKKPTFNKPARGDYDGNGTVEGVVDEYEGLIHRIEGALTDGHGSGIGSPEMGFGYEWKGGHPYWGLGTNQNTPPDPDSAKVAYNFVLFEHDLHGAALHNTAYAIQVLRASWTNLGRTLLANPNWTPPGDEWVDNN